MEKTLDVSVIIVNYNTKELTRNCLKSVFERTDGIAFEVIVSDNGSTDGSLEMIRAEFPEVILIENGANLGFGAANNRALAVARGKYVFYLNSDTVLLNNAVKMFFDYWENSSERDEIGALGCNLLDMKLNTNLSYGRFPCIKSFYKSIVRQFASEYIKPFVSFLIKKHTHFLSDFEPYYGDVDFITGADMFVKNDENAFFDETFFMFYEETDLQFRMKLLGLKRRLIDGPKIIHYWGGSSISLKNFNYKKKANIYSDMSGLKYLKKIFGKGIYFHGLKFLYLIIWCLPNNILYTRKYLKELVNI